EQAVGSAAHLLEDGDRELLVHRRRLLILWGRLGRCAPGQREHSVRIAALVGRRALLELEAGRVERRYCDDGAAQLTAEGFGHQAMDHTDAGQLAAVDVGGDPHGRAVAPAGGDDDGDALAQSRGQLERLDGSVGEAASSRLGAADLRWLGHWSQGYL